MKMKLYYLFFMIVVGSAIGQNSAIVGNLPEDLNENSGLILYNGKLITHNDSDNLPELIELDTTSLHITRRITISNAANIDWEDITQDDTHIYIGDIGNNNGIREDLVIYKVQKSDFDAFDTVTAEKLTFSYEDQVSFNNNGLSDWDAESLIILDGHLVIFTKQWKGKQTAVYKIPTNEGDYKATRIEMYNTNGLVTGATYNTLSDVLLLIGYTDSLEPFVVRVEKPSIQSIFGDKLNKINLDSGIAQIEGVTFINENRYFISSEFFIDSTMDIQLNPQLYSFLDVEWKAEEQQQQEQQEEIIEEAIEGFIIFKQQKSNILHYQYETHEANHGRAIFDLSGRLVDFIMVPNDGSKTIDISWLNSSLYYLTLYVGNDVVTKAFIKD